jgi:chemotaxis protein CheD
MVGNANEDIACAGHGSKSMALALTTAVNFSEMKTSCNPVETLVAFSIGSGIGMTIYDPVSIVGGVLNFILPDSTPLGRAKREMYPFMFADTGIDAFVNALMDLGAEVGRMKVIIAGGAQVLDLTGAFNIGQQNFQAAKSIIAAKQIPVYYEDIGGTQPRTLRLDMGSGNSFIILPGRGECRI